MRLCFGAGFLQCINAHKNSNLQHLKQRERWNLPVSLELVIKGQLGARRDQLGGEEPNSELPIHSPLRQGKKKSDHGYYNSQAWLLFLCEISKTNPSQSNSNTFKLC